MPKQNGYQSLHTTVITKDKKIIEFQIRTKEMHEYAEHGLAASFYYNEQKLTESYRTGKIQHLPTSLLWITELQDTAAKLRAGKKVDIKKLRLNLFADKIFVYTPKGDIIDLPKGSLPLDFAYRLHSEIGGHVTGVKIMPGFCKSEEVFTKNRCPKDITFTFSDGSTYKTTLTRKYNDYQTVNFPSAVDTSSIRITINSSYAPTYDGKRYDDCGISEIQVF